MHPGAAVTDLRAGHGWRAVLPARRARRAAHTLRDIFIGLAVLVRPRTEAFDRGVDDPRVQFLKALPGEALAVEHAGAEILDDHIGAPDQLLDHGPALRRLQIDRDAALVRIQHREIEAVRTLHVLQLAAGDVAAAGHLDLDHVGTHPGQQLRPGRARLNMAQIENAYAVKGFGHRSSHLNSSFPRKLAPRGHRPLVAPGPRFRGGDGFWGAGGRVTSSRLVSRKSPCSTTCAASPSGWSRATRSAR